MEDHQQLIPMIQFNEVRFSYSDKKSEGLQAIDDLSVTIPRGSHTAVLGHNGSGKSTFARLCNCLELPDEGEIFVDGFSAGTIEDVYRIRQICGMVFQNPDNQIVGTTVEEDTAFGPENLGLSSEEIRERVDSALTLVGLLDKAKRAPSRLSGGQKQKLAIAGAMAMQPSCLILDEACAMLDPVASDEFMVFADGVCKKEGLTLIQITHDMNQALMADRIIVLSQGKLIADGTPREIFTRPDFLTDEGLMPPPHLLIMFELAKELAEYPEMAQRLCSAFTEEECAAAAAELLKPLAESIKAKGLDLAAPRPKSPGERVVVVDHLSYSYRQNSGEENKALDNISFEVRKGEIFVLCGHSGSGKSTLITHLNGLYRSEPGRVTVMGLDCADKKNLTEVRRHTGLVFQYPEYQLFEATVGEDVAFGPLHMGVSPEETKKRVEEALRLVNIDQEWAERSPFELSGGQKRRVAIAGILAMHPDILVLDEPAAGLDPQGREEMMRYIESMRDMGKTVIMVTHNMDDAARLADYMAVLEHGRLAALDEPRVIFKNTEKMYKWGLKPPAALQFANLLNAELGTHFSFMTCEEAVKTLARCIREGEEA